MDYYCLFTETYQSQLGPLILLINSTKPLFETDAITGVYRTESHEIIIKKMIPDSDWLPSVMRVESANAWLFYIKKCNAAFEQLSFSIGLDKTETALQCEAATGQNLIAIELENGRRQMHIGTEDEEAMAYRASSRNDMPARFENPLLKYEIQITTITSCGLSSQIPVLELGEIFYFHYVIAENPCRQSIDYHEELDCSTWFTVDQSKEQLEKIWRA